MVSLRVKRAWTVETSCVGLQLQHFLIGPEQIAHGQHPDDRAVFRDRQVADALFLHQSKCFHQRFTVLDGDHGFAHAGEHHGCVRIQSLGHGLPAEIRIRDDADVTCFYAHSGLPRT